MGEADIEKRNTSGALRPGELMTGSAPNNSAQKSISSSHIPHHLNSGQGQEYPRRDKCRTGVDFPLRIAQAEVWALPMPQIQPQRKRQEPKKREYPGRRPILPHDPRIGSIGDQPAGANVDSVDHEAKPGKKAQEVYP